MYQQQGKVFSLTPLQQADDETFDKTNHREKWTDTFPKSTRLNFELFSEEILISDYNMTCLQAWTFRRVIVKIKIMHRKNASQKPNSLKSVKFIL